MKELQKNSRRRESYRMESNNSVLLSPSLIILSCLITFWLVAVLHHPSEQRFPLNLISSNSTPITEGGVLSSSQNASLTISTWEIIDNARFGMIKDRAYNFKLLVPTRRQTLGSHYA